MPRMYNFDYRKPNIYHITIRKDPMIPLLSSISGTPDKPIVDKSPIGKCVEDALRLFPQFNPDLRLLQYVIMPDHIHFLIHVKEYLPLHLGKYMAMFKIKAHQIARERGILDSTIFLPDFYDSILFRHRYLNVIFDYIRDNPRRLLSIRTNSNFFRRIYNYNIDNHS